MLNGELGLKCIDEYVDNRMLNFWCNVATGDENKISTILYKWIKVLDIKEPPQKSPWLDKIKSILNNIGMSNIYDSINSVNKT